MTETASSDRKQHCAKFETPHTASGRKEHCGFSGIDPSVKLMVLARTLLVFKVNMRCFEKNA